MLFSLIVADLEGFIKFSRDKIDLLVKVAYLYYHENETQAEIANLLGLSRPTIANLLQQAREEGIVTISLSSEYLSSMSLSFEFKKHFGLDDVLIVPGQKITDPSLAKAKIGLIAASYLEQNIQPGDVIATAWGITMLEVALALSNHKFENLTIAQALGGLSTADSFNPGHVATLMAEKLGARVYHLYVPAVVESSEIRDILMRDSSIRAAFEVARSAHSAILGIGKIAHDATVVKAGFFSAGQMDELRLKGAVGDIFGRFFDIHGRPVVTEIDERIIALSLSDLKDIRPVISVAGGKDKEEAILGALNGGYVNILITDENTARNVLKMSHLYRQKSEPVNSH